jgi:hypothetical protein
MEAAAAAAAYHHGHSSGKPSIAFDLPIISFTNLLLSNLVGDALVFRIMVSFSF